MRRKHRAWQWFSSHLHLCWNNQDIKMEKNNDWGVISNDGSQVFGNYLTNQSNVANPRQGAATNDHADTRSNEYVF